MKPEECTSDFIYFIEEDALLDNRRSGRRPITPVDGHDLAHQRVNGWQRVMLSAGYDLPKGARSGSGGSGYDEDAYYIVAMPERNGQFARPYGDPEFEFEALISF
jgi:hypothetical protein